MPEPRAVFQLADLARDQLSIQVLRRWLAGLVLSLLLSASAVASEPLIREGERLSDWILRQARDPLSYPSGLVWQVPAEREAQAKLKHHLLALLISSEQASLEARQRLTRLIEAAPVTGRVAVPQADPRWLQAHPKQDPVLAYGHSVTLSQLPNTVTVLADDGRQCVLPHRPGLEARGYLSACQPASIDRVDHAWIVQPDGTARRFGNALWNAEPQDEPAPGAQLWAPARDAGWSPRFSLLLAEFLATQEIRTPAQTAATSRADLPVHLPTEGRTPARDAKVSANDWGMIGVLQTPTARMSPAGEGRFHFSRVLPYERSNIIFQPLDWLEAGFRYTTVTNRLYGTAELSGDQTYKDKSVDLKIKLTKEQAYLPQIAVGVIDIGGTGLFASEYLVASKRTGNIDWNLGIGWGYLGGSSNIRNPLSLLSTAFDTRPGSTSTSGGTVNSKAFFHGTTALFGGAQYQTPMESLLLKVEYDGNNYQNEPQANNQKQTSPINLGLVYRYHPSVDITAGLERGNTFMLGLTFHGALDKISTPKVSDTPMVPVLATRPTKEPYWEVTVADIVDQSRWSVRQISREGSEIRVALEDPYGTYWNERIDRIAAILHRDAPAEISSFVLTFVEQGMPISGRVILRDSWAKKHLHLQAMSERYVDIASTEPRPALSGQALWARNDNGFAYGLVPHYQQNLGGPDGFLLFQLGVAAPMKLKFSESVAITGQASLGLIDNYDKFKYDAPSNLPRVRTLLREYQTTSAVMVPNLQATHVGQLSGNQFYSVYGGLLETMYAGVGGEWLYRPWHSPYAFGVDVNYVRQRDFKNFFGLRDYSVVTGHATLNWDTGWKSTHISLSAGRYLAKDWGATVDVSRTFNNGVSIGAYATKTNVTAEQFGEGSFDKGIYVKIPFDVMMTSLSPVVANLNWSPLTRDGGARLNRSTSLYSMTNPRSKRHTSYSAANSLDPFHFDEDAPLWATEQRLFEDFGKSGSTLGHHLTQGNTGDALLLGGGLVLASSLLDRPLAKWANNHQSDRWNKIGKAANFLPFALAAGTGMLWWGLGDDVASTTAWTSIKSAALTLAVETTGKFVVGRSRPEKELGAADFSPLSKGAGNSSFPSTHLGLAYALVTPFAQQYDAPWLYGLAGMTAFGRIQQRQHFASDVVAGALIGYGIGSLLLNEQQQRRGMPRITIGPDRSIQATWEFKYGIEK